MKFKKVSLSLLLISVVLISCKKNSASLETDEPFWDKTSVSDGISFMSLIVSSRGTLLASTGSYGYHALNDGYIYRSVDHGQSWDEIDLNVDGSNCIIEQNSKLFAATTQGIYISEDDGSSWAHCGLDTTIVSSLDAYKDERSDIIVAGTLNGIFKSDDEGQSWQKISTEYCTDDIGILTPTTIFVGQFGGVGADLIVSRDGGLTWNISLSGLGTTYINISNGSIYAGGYRSDEWFGGLHFSIDSGITWTELFSVDKSVTSTHISADNTIYLCGYFTGVQMKKNGASDWTELNSGLSSLWITDLALDSNKYLYAASDLGGIFKSREPIQ